MNATNRHLTTISLILASLKPLLEERTCFGFPPNAFEGLCDFVSRNEMVQLGATRLIFQRAVRPIAAVYAFDAPARISRPIFEPVAINRDGLAMYALTADQAHRFATIRGTLPRLDVHLEATLAVRQKWVD